MKPYFAHGIGPAMGLAACAVAAWLLTLVRWNAPAREIVPFAFLGLVLALGVVFGRAVGMIGSIVAALVFAHSMYPPVGSLRVSDAGARSGLAWMLLAGVTLSYLLLPGRHDEGDHKRSP